MFAESIKSVRLFIIGGGKKTLNNAQVDENVYRAEIEKLQKIIGKQARQYTKLRFMTLKEEVQQY